MSQHDLNIANQTFPNTRTDLNNALQALGSNSSGTSAPSTTFANQFWYDTANNIFYIRNEDNDANIEIMKLDQTNDTVEYFKSDSIRTALIEFTDGDDALTIADGGALTTSGNLSIGGSNNELRFMEGSNFVGFEAPALTGDQIFVLPSADGSADQVLKTNGSGVLSFTDVSAGTNPTISSVSPSTITNDATNVTISGTGFVTVPNVEVMSTSGAITTANSVSFTNATTIVANLTLATDGTYFVRVENPDGLAVRSSSAILTVSDAPTWTTSAGSLGTVASGGTMNFTIGASGDAPLAYSVASGSLPSGASLNSSTGVISGTESGSLSSETTFSFTARVTDAQSQTADRAFTITVTVGMNNTGQFN
tara:strand:- start:3083 stop:4180 length:1098 start_codon:yes stop_codon:yes gene_type:complete